MSIEQPEIYISYSWREESLKVAEELEAQIKKCGLELIRDKINGVGYMKSISEFMNKIGKGKYILLILGNDYLKSPNCMYELSKIAEYSNYDFTKIQERIFIVTLPSFSVYSALDRAKIIRYWEEENAKLQNAVKSGNDVTHYTQIVLKDIPIVKEILNIFSTGVIDKIADLNTLVLNIHKNEGYKQVISKLVETINEDTNGEINLSSINFTSLLNQIETKTTPDKSKETNMEDLKIFKKEQEELINNADFRNVFKNIDECDFIEYDKTMLNILRKEAMISPKSYDFHQRLLTFIDDIKLKK